MSSAVHTRPFAPTSTPVASCSLLEILPVEMNANNNIRLGGIKSIFSRKNSSQTQPSRTTASVRQEDHSHPQRNAIPRTRRPRNDPPPAYTPAPSAAVAPQTSNRAGSSVPTNQGADDQYAFLSTFDTVFLIDDSGSMAGYLWRETKEALRTITPVCTAHDADGIDLYFLNHADSSLYHNVSSVSTIVEIFEAVRPGGSTLTGKRLNNILRPYLRRYEAAPETTKPLNIIVITDGEPADDVESPLIAAAKKLDKLDAPAWQLGVQFFQVGKDESAKKHLKELDDELAAIAGDEEMRDIVDTVPFTGEHGGALTGDGVLKVVLGSVLRRLDRKSKELHR